MRKLAPVLVAVAVATAVLAAYAGLGGGRYAPSPVADPCLARAGAGSDATAAGLQRILLEAVDGAACTLGVSREELVLSLRNRSSFEKLAARNGIPEATAERAISDALGTAFRTAEDKGGLSGFTAGIARRIAEKTPPWLLLDLIDRLRSLFT